MARMAGVTIPVSLISYHFFLLILTSTLKHEETETLLFLCLPEVLINMHHSLQMHLYNIVSRLNKDDGNKESKFLKPNS